MPGGCGEKLRTRDASNGAFPGNAIITSQFPL